MNYLYEEMRSGFGIPTVQEGRELYRRQAVISLLVDGRALQAKMSDPETAETYAVTLDMDFFAISQCGCQVEGYSRHMASLIFLVHELQNYRPSRS